MTEIAPRPRPSGLRDELSPLMEAAINLFRQTSAVDGAQAGALLGTSAEAARNPLSNLAEHGLVDVIRTASYAADKSEGHTVWVLSDAGYQYLKIRDEGFARDGALRYLRRHYRSLRIRKDGRVQVAG